MVTICVKKNEEQKIVGFTVAGHAGYSEAGSDIVCAAVTVTAMTAVNGLTDVAEIDCDIEVQRGKIVCALPEQLSPKARRDADVLLESMMLSFENLVLQYEAYVSLQTEKA